MQRCLPFLTLLLIVTGICIGDAIAQKPNTDRAAQVPDKLVENNQAARKLLTTQLVAAQKSYRAAMENMEVQQVGGLLVLVKGDQHPRPEVAYQWSLRWMQAQYALSPTRNEKIAAVEDHQKRMTQLNATAKLLIGNGNSGLLADSEGPAADWYLAEAELLALKEKAM